MWLRWIQEVFLIVKCPYCGGDCVEKNIKKKVDRSGTLTGGVTGAAAGFIVGGPVGAAIGGLIGGVIGSAGDKVKYVCTKCGAEFDSLEELKSKRC